MSGLHAPSFQQRLGTFRELQKRQSTPSGRSASADIICIDVQPATAGTLPPSDSDEDDDEVDDSDSEEEAPPPKPKLPKPAVETAKP